jgi:hypothetical protein
MRLKEKRDARRAKHQHKKPVERSARRLKHLADVKEWWSCRSLPRGLTRHDPDVGSTTFDDKMVANIEPEPTIKRHVRLR